MSSVGVSARDLSKDYVDSTGSVVHACRSLTFEAHADQVFGILGTNGAGKTTTLRMLSTVLRPSGGDALVSGHSVAREPDMVRKEIGFLSSDTGVYGRLTAREMMEYFGRLHGLSEARVHQRVTEIAVILDMTSFLDRRCDKLSTGQKQRVNIARTIIHDPSVLIFDEPTAGLDILAASQIVRFIRDSRNMGKCVILSTHIMREAERLCDRLIILHQGRIRAEGTVEDLRRRFGHHDLEDVFLEAIGEPVS
jgi:sodium transport system ATP-binding protein